MLGEFGHMSFFFVPVARNGLERLLISMLTLQKTLTLTLRNLRMGGESNGLIFVLLRFEVHT